MKTDFRKAKNVTKTIIEEMNSKDKLYTWKCEVIKSEIRIYWQYLSEITHNKECFKITNIEDESDEAEDAFIVLRDGAEIDEFGEMIDGRLVGDKYHYYEGSLGKCVKDLLELLYVDAHSRY